MSIYVDIDVNPDPDCYDDLGFVLYVLRPPTVDYPLQWNDDESCFYDSDITRFGGDIDEAERYICLELGLDLRRYMDGCYARREAPPDNIREILAKHNIIINKIGERLDENC